MMIIEDIVSQHAEEAAFLWLLRDGAVRAPHYNLKDLADLEERVDCSAYLARALELALLRSDEPLFNTSATANRQPALLGTA